MYTKKEDAIKKIKLIFFKTNKYKKMESSIDGSHDTMDKL